MHIQCVDCGAKQLNLCGPWAGGDVHCRHDSTERIDNGLDSELKLLLVHYSPQDILEAVRRLCEAA